MPSESPNSLDKLKQELESFWKDRFDNMMNGNTAAFHSKAVESTANILSESAKLVQEAMVVKGTTGLQVVPSSNIAFAMLGACRSEKCAEFSRIAMLASGLNEAVTMAAAIPKKIDGVKI